MKKLLSKILISVAILGIFLMPISADIKINDKIKINFSTQKTQAQTPEWWFEYLVPGFGPQIKTFADETSCKDSETEISKTNTISKSCQNGRKPTRNILGQEVEPDTNYGCGVSPSTWFTNCIVEFLHTIIWKALAAITKFAASILDFFIYYSTNSEAYSNGFIENAWATVRDIANLFFIIGLLYVAIKTILGLNVTDNKKIIGSIIIIALIINFSLFATKVVIDASNVLAKIFYNQITPLDPNGNKLDPADGGEKSVTVGIVDMINPQSIILGDPVNNLGQFTIILFISLAMMGYLIFMFLSIALLFVARVASLWIAMIFSPIAFITYALPVKIPSLGFKEWSKNLIEQAFMAPIFIFFLYIILLLGKSLKAITYNTGAGADVTLQNTMASVVPMLIIFVLLRNAKEIAVSYSGKMGEAFNSFGGKIAGFAGGAALGATAYLGTRAIGGAASKYLKSNEENLKQKANEKGIGGAIARTQLRALNYGAKSSFDVRQTAAGRKLVKATGLDLQSSELIGLGSKVGGIKGANERKLEEIKKESELYKTTMSNDQVKKWAKDNGHVDEKGDALFNSADELNKYRMDAFTENLGKTGLIGTLAYEAVGVNERNYTRNDEYRRLHKQKAMEKERVEKGDSFDENTFNAEYADKDLDYDKAIANQITDSKIKTAKLLIGSALAISTGGALGGFVGAGIGAGAVAQGSIESLLVDTPSEQKFAANRTKDEAKLAPLKKLLKENEDAIKNANTNITVEVKDASGNKLNFVDEKGKVNKDVVKKAEAMLKLENEDLNNQLKFISEDIYKLEGKNDLFSNTERARLEGLKNAKRAELTVNISNTQSVAELKGAEDRVVEYKEKIAKEGSSSHGKSQGKPNIASPDAHAPKAHDSSHDEHKEDGHAKDSHGH